VRKHGLAVWDVLASCTRESSLDSDIDEASIVPNDFAGFFREHPGIRRVFFNGAKAEQSFRRHVLPALGSAPDAAPERTYTRLPSTSPAHAAMSFERKLEAWRVLLAEDDRC
jgi:hypoxanthine-DNA glycosylase